MKHRAFWVRFFLVASLLTAAAIFWFSAQQAADSQAMSDTITVRAARIVRPDFDRLPPEAQLSFLEAVSRVVRKCAHFLEYALLGFNLMGFFRLWRIERTAVSTLGLAWLAGTLYAVTDELHQLFVNERSAAALDVMIDSGGALTGALFMAALLTPLLRKLK